MPCAFAFPQLWLSIPPVGKVILRHGSYDDSPCETQLYHQTLEDVEDRPLSPVSFRGCLSGYRLLSGARGEM